MVLKVKSEKVGSKKVARKQCGINYRRGTKAIVRAKTATVIRKSTGEDKRTQNTSFHVYSKMYDQEAKDIERALGVLGKYAQN